MSSFDELRDSFALADSPWELCRKTIRSPDASEASEAHVTDEASMANKVSRENEVVNHPSSPGWFVVEVPHLVGDPPEELPEVKVKVKPEEFVVDEAEARGLERLFASYEADPSKRSTSKKWKKTPKK